MAGVGSLERTRKGVSMGMSCSSIPRAPGTWPFQSRTASCAWEIVEVISAVTSKTRFIMPGTLTKEGARRKSCVDGVITEEMQA